MSDTVKYTADSFCQTLIGHAGLTTDDAIYIRNSFIPNRYTEILAVKDFNKYNNNDDAIVKVVINRETGKVMSYTVNIDIKLTVTGDRLSKWIDYLMNVNAVVDIDYTQYKKYHALRYEADNITVVVTRDNVIPDNLLHYFFDESTKDIFRCDDTTKYKYHPQTITYEELEAILTGLANGKKILPNAINTGHIQDKAITANKLADKYAMESEIADARVDGVDGIKHETLKAHLNTLAEYIVSLREKVQDIETSIDTINNTMNSYDSTIAFLENTTEANTADIASLRNSIEAGTTE